MTGGEFLADDSYGQVPHVPAREVLAGVGKAVSCVMARYHRPLPRRYVWHHVLPLACGGTTEPANLVSLCDSCHYSVHDLLWLLANGQPVDAVPVNRRQLACAEAGLKAARAQGTVAKIPREA